MKVFITGEMPDITRESLLKAGFDITEYVKTKPISQKNLIKNVKDCDAIISLLSDKITEEVLSNAPNCKIVANYAAGFNNIDIEYAKKKNIIVTNTPDILTNATAEIAVSLVLASSRRIVEGDSFMRKGKFTGWKSKLLLGMELKGKTVGIVGAGRIGQETGKILKSFGTNIIYYNKTSKKEFEKEVNGKKVTLEKLLKEADIISLHLPLNKDTYNLLSKEKLDLLKETAILINTARGEILDEKYLIELLKKKRIFGAGFDVYEGEPDFNIELLKLENVVLLPHIGSATFETRNKMAKLCVDNVINVLKNKKPITPVF